jgi:hypothetical protein
MATTILKWTKITLTGHVCMICCDTVIQDHGGLILLAAESFQAVAKIEVRRATGEGGFHEG